MNEGAASRQQFFEKKLIIITLRYASELRNMHDVALSN